MVMSELLKESEFSVFKIVLKVEDFYYSDCLS